MKPFIFTIILSLALISCDKNKEQPADAGLIIIRSATEFNNALNGNQQSTGDPYTLKDFHIDGDSAFLTVSYSGGCNKHVFSIIWNESYIKTYPPQADILVVHNAGTDACEALITETLTFDLGELIGPIDYETITINILNPGSPSDTINAKWYPSEINVQRVVIPQGDLCQVEVTASRVVCGAGMYENLWFALNDSINAGVEGSYFRKWLQPVAINDELKGFRPVPGKKYLVGAKIQETHPYNDVVICLAYSGPSIPVKITCITELQ